MKCSESKTRHSTSESPAQREMLCQGALCLCVHVHGWEQYRVIHKKVSRKTEDKMQEKKKMILQVDENLAHLQQQYSESFCEKIYSKSAFLQSIWYFLCLTSMILMTTKYLENLHRDSPLSQYSITKTLFAPGSPHDSKMPFEQLFLDVSILSSLF